jgi:TRAP-type C4-dicarboxylate transport system permease small subunit
MSFVYRRLMDVLYVLCVVVAGFALVAISAVIPWAVYTRYVLNSAASWPEPTAVLLTIVLTFFGAAACYREGLHMKVTIIAELLPPPMQQAVVIVREVLVGALGLFMTVFGLNLVDTTWQNSIAEFPALSVGVTYLPIPIGAVILILFVVERLTLGSPPSMAGQPHGVPLE